MKKWFLVSIAVFFLYNSFSQQAGLIIRSGTKGLYLEHKAEAKEGLFPLGRLYNVHPRHIAAYNNIDFNKGLSVGQIIKIPLTDTNFNQKINEGTPVIYVTKERETLANISIKNKLVPMSKLRSWNNLTVDNLPADTKLIVGYLVKNEATDVAVAEDKKENLPVVETKKEEVVKKPDVEIKKADPPVVKEELKKIETEIVKESPPVVIKEEPKKTIPAIAVREEKPSENEVGFFKNYFNEQVRQTPLSKEQTLASSVFKSANGWKDAKYYILINGVEPGTIVKITNPSNNKVAFAKVLYAMEGIRQNDGLDIRISDAAATALSISDTEKFILKVSY